ncbi:MAG: hypothetical protein A6F72_02380 [Cycloclasticus sp. symbiont of Poecilosclerida sp. N]|nr:MAG: hypothetical protein A6F72_02380 [Cycloclasticus sp. symbiont of Poecilosclerida sp. N]
MLKAPTVGKNWLKMLIHTSKPYFLISSLSFNLFALMRELLPEQLAQHRVVTVPLALCHIRCIG